MLLHYDSLLLLHHIIQECSLLAVLREHVEVGARQALHTRQEVSELGSNGVDDHLPRIVDVELGPSDVTRS